MPGRFREIREDKDVEETKDVPTLEDYSRYDGFVKDVAKDLRENPLTPEEEQEIDENIDEAARTAEEALRKGRGGSQEISGPAENPPTLEDYSRFDGFVEAVRRDLQENPLILEEKQEIDANIDEAEREAEAVSRSHRVGEAISPPVEKLVEHHTPPDSLQERRFMPQDPHNPDTGEATENPVDIQSPKPQERVHTSSIRESEPLSTMDVADLTRFKRIDDFEEYQQALRAFPDEAESPRFADLDYQVRTFFNLRKYPREGAPVDFIADTIGIPAETLQKWIDGVERPSFLAKLEQRVVKATGSEPVDMAEGKTTRVGARQDQESGPQKLVVGEISDFCRIKADISNPVKQWEELHRELIKDELGKRLLEQWGKQVWRQLETLLTRHPQLQEYTTFDTKYKHALWYRVLREAQANAGLPDVSWHKLSQSTGVSKTSLHNWLVGKKVPHLFGSIEKHEHALRQWESKLPQKSLPHTFNPSHIYKTFQPTRIPEQRTPQVLAKCIEALLVGATSSPQVHIAYLHPYYEKRLLNPVLGVWLRDVANAIKSESSEIERLLNRWMGLDQNPYLKLRIAVDNDTLYIWRRNTHPDNWLNIYAHELFYFRSPKEKQQLIDLAASHLNTTTHGLGQLVTQLSDHPSVSTEPRARLCEFKLHKSHLRGESLHLLLNATNQTLTDVQPHIIRIGKLAHHQGGISSPRFPTGEKYDELRTRLFAIIACDGHVMRTTLRVQYTDCDKDRVKYVKTLFHQLGDIHYNQDSLPDGRNTLALSAVAGRLLVYWGIPPGDKHLHPNFRVPTSIRNGAFRIRRAYLEELVPEDGYFASRGYQKIFGVKRAQILDAGQKTESYNFEVIISREQKSFIRQHGKEKIFCIRPYRPRKVFILQKGELEQLEKVNNPQIRQKAHDIKRMIYENPSLLLEDEISLCKSLG